MRYFHVDLLDLGGPRLSFRRLVVLLRSLPRESLYVSARLGDRARWGETEHLLGDLVDLMQIFIWQHGSVHSKRRIKRPKQIKRPGVDRPGEQKFGNARMTLAEVRVYLDRFKPKGGDDGS